MALEDYTDLSESFRRNPRKTSLVAVFAVGVCLATFLFQGFCSEMGRQLATGPETARPKATTSSGGDTAPGIRAETNGANSPNIIGNKDEVKVEIGAGSYDSTKTEGDRE